MLKLLLLLLLILLLHLFLHKLLSRQSRCIHCALLARSQSVLLCRHLWSDTLR